MDSWQVQVAKARFSELLRAAVHDGPQDVTLRGKSVAVVVSREQFDRLCGAGLNSLAAFMRASPLYGHDEVSLQREHGSESLPRKLQF